MESLLFWLLILDSILIVLASLCVALLFWQHDEIKSEVKTLKIINKVLCTYLSTMIVKHNLLCKEVGSCCNTINYVTEVLNQVIIDQEKMQKQLNETTESVNYLISNWQDDWQSGESWKREDYDPNEED